MAQRAFWKGYLKLSLVTCRVAMTPATSDREKVRFHTINARTGNRLVSRYVDAVTGKPVDPEDEARGYPRGEDDHVLIGDDELDAVALESTHTIDVDAFVPADSIGWLWYDRPHYLLPDDAVGEEAFSVIREAMQSTGMVGVSRLVLYRRERAVMLEPRDQGIVLWTLRYGDEVRDASDYFAGLDEDRPDPELMKLVLRLIDERTRPWDPDMVHDPVQERLLDLIETRRKGRKRPTRTPEPAEEPASNVVSIMDALRRSIASESASRKKSRK